MRVFGNDRLPQDEGDFSLLWVDWEEVGLVDLLEELVNGGVFFELVALLLVFDD